MLDQTINFGKVTVSTGYNNSATSIVLTTGHGARLPDADTVGEFNLVWWNSTDYADPTDDPNVEIIRCTAISTDTLTVTRAQEGTSASNKNTGGKTYKMILAVTKKMIDDIQEALTGDNEEVMYIDSNGDVIKSPNFRFDDGIINDTPVLKVGDPAVIPDVDTGTRKARLAVEDRIKVYTDYSGGIVINHGDGADDVTAAFTTEVDGLLLNYGSNFGQANQGVNLDKAGGFMRLELRLEYAEQFFALCYIPDDQSSASFIFRIGSTGNYLAEGSARVFGMGVFNDWVGVDLPAGADNSYLDHPFQVGLDYEVIVDDPTDDGAGVATQIFGDCSDFVGDQEACEDHPGCSIGMADCEGLDDATCAATDGCTTNFDGNCNEFDGDEGACGSHPECTYEDGICSGTYFYCTGDFYSGDCTGTYTPDGYYEEPPFTSDTITYRVYNRKTTGLGGVLIYSVNYTEFDVISGDTGAKYYVTASWSGTGDNNQDSSFILRSINGGGFDEYMIGGANDFYDDNSMWAAWGGGAPTPTAYNTYEKFHVDEDGNAVPLAAVRLKTYTVATLPAGSQGDKVYVTDALSPTWHDPVVGGGSVVTPVFYDGADWIVD